MVLKDCNPFKYFQLGGNYKKIKNLLCVTLYGIQVFILKPVDVLGETPDLLDVLQTFLTLKSRYPDSFHSPSCDRFNIVLRRNFYCCSQCEIKTYQYAGFLNGNTV